MFGIVLGLINPILVSVQNVFAKFGLIRNDVEDLAVVFARFFYVVPVLGLFLAWQGMPESIGGYFWIVIFLLVILEIPSQWCYHQSFKEEYISLVMPIQTLLIIPMLSSFLFFGGWSWLGALGCLVIMVGVYVLQIAKEGFSTKEILRPIKSIFYLRSSRYMVITILLWTITTPLQKVAVNNANVALMGILFLSFCSLGTLLWGNLVNRIPATAITLPPGVGKLIPIGLFAGGAAIAQYSALYYLNPVYVIALKETILLWAIIWDVLFFKYYPNRTQLASTLIILFGVTILVIGIT